MKFGQVDDPGSVDFTLPEDHPDTAKVLAKYKDDKKPFEVFVGCAKWNKTDLKGFYPRGTKDELAYYSNQFNSIELNATFYKSPSKSQVITWASSPMGSSFSPKYHNPSAILEGCRMLSNLLKNSVMPLVVLKKSWA